MIIERYKFLDGIGRDVVATFLISRVLFLLIIRIQKYLG